MQVQGKYKRFWGSDQWSIRIDFSYEIAKTIKFDSLSVEFKNDKNSLFNSFEVSDLCSCVSLMMKFGEGFGIAIFDRRLVSWMEEYFEDHGLKIPVRSIRNCLKKELDEKIDVKVKKLTIVDKTFTDILKYNPQDLIIDFAEYFKDELWEIGEKDQINFPLDSSYTFNLDNQRTTNKNTISITNNYNGKLDVFVSLQNDKQDTLTNVTIEEIIAPEFKPLKVKASLVAPDKTILGIFQPLVIKQEEGGLKITWKIDELKINHRIEIEYVLVQRIPVILKLNADQGEQKYHRYFDITSDEINKFKLEIPALIESQNFTQSKVESIIALMPIELEAQSILYVFPHYILKIIDLGFFQRLTFSDLFIEKLFYENIELEGNILPVLTLFESFVPQIGSKLIKKIFRNHSYSNPIVMYNLETSTSHTIEVIEEYPNSTVINLVSLGNQTLREEFETTSDKNKKLIFNLNATNDTILFSLSTGFLMFDLEKALISVQDTSLKEKYEIFQAINVESIVDQTNKNYLDFKNFKIISDTVSNKIRLRSFSLKIVEKEQDRESQVNDTELDKAFETLKQTESLAALKEKIKSSYAASFTTENQEKQILPIETSSETITGDEEPHGDEKETLIIANDELSEQNKSEIGELDSFINDYENDSDEKSEEYQAHHSQDGDQKYSSTLSENHGELESNEATDIEENELISKENSLAFEKTTSQDETNLNNSLQQDQSKSDQKTKRKKKKSKKRKMKVEKPAVLKEAEIIEFKVVFEEYPSSEQISSNVLDSDSKVVFLDKNEEIINQATSKSYPGKVYLKLPKNERFLILLVNPREFPGAHIYGRWKPRDIHNYKVLLSNTTGLWHIKIQLLESGNTHELDFQMD